ncbi:MAG: AP2 domain-containing protein [Oligoflexia bacterium]|nr:AP2 domain-containing protein [Oligoflexia bacterium]
MKQKTWRYVSLSPTLKMKIDSEDFKRVSEHKWRATKGTTGRLRVVTSIREKNKNRTITLGKFLMKPPKGKQVYPRRFNAELDYRKGNLIVCTLKERQQTLPKNRKRGSSIFRGVSFIKAIKKWRAGIEVNGRAINLGNFKKEDDAALAYNAAAKKHFGSNAYVNRIDRKLHKRRD